MCVSDEHYMASLMASYGLENATDCKGRVSYADWAPGGWHPRTFSAKDITSSLVQRMRGGGQAAAVQAAALLDAAAPNMDAETAAAVAQAFAATLADAEAEVAAELEAAKAAAQLQDAADKDADGPPLPACEAAAAIHSALTLVFQPRGTPTGTQHSVSPAHAGPEADEFAVPAQGMRGGTTAGGAAEAATQPAAAAAATGRRPLSTVRLHLQCQQPAQQRTYAGLASWQRSLRLLQEGGQRLAALKSGNSAEGAAADAARDVGAARWMVSAGYVPLGSHCPLFARKFTAGVVNETLAMALSCAGIGLGSWCAEQQWLALVHG